MQHTKHLQPLRSEIDYLEKRMSNVLALNKAMHEELHHNWDERKFIILIDEPDIFLQSWFIHFTKKWNVRRCRKDRNLEKIREFKSGSSIAGEKRDYIYATIRGRLDEIGRHELPIHEITTKRPLRPTIDQVFELIAANIYYQEAQVNEWVRKARFHVLSVIKDELKKKIKRLRRQLNSYITIDIRYQIRTIIRSIRVTPFDGKEAGSDFSVVN